MQRKVLLSQAPLQHQGDRIPRLDQSTQDGISGGGHHTSLCLMPICADVGSWGTGQGSPDGISCANKALQRLCTTSQQGSSHPNQGKCFLSAICFHCFPTTSPGCAFSSAGRDGHHRPHSPQDTFPAPTQRWNSQGQHWHLSTEGSEGWRKSESQQISQQAVNSASRFKPLPAFPHPALGCSSHSRCHSSHGRRTGMCEAGSGIGL